MSDNARFHNKLHRKNHHTTPTPGYPDSATDPIASSAEPFQGDFFLNGNLNVSGAINTIFNTLSNISIPTPVLSATVGFNPTNSLIVQLSGVKYAIPVTYIGNQAPPVVVANSLSGVTTFSNGVSVLGSLSGVDSIKWNSVSSIVAANSANWLRGYYAYTSVNPNSANWQSTYTTVLANSAAWSSYQAYALDPVLLSIRPTNGSNIASGTRSTVGGGDVNTASGYKSYIGGGDGNTASGDCSFTGGGDNNISQGAWSVIAGGQCNVASGNSSVVAGGYGNVITGDGASIVGGTGNTASAYFAQVGGGSSNSASGNYSVVAGGYGNLANSPFSFIGGGSNNCTIGDRSAILGGTNNTLSGNDSFIIGSNITASLPNFTFVNNLSSQNLVQASSAYSSFLSVGASGTNAVLPNTISQFFATNNSYAQINIQNTGSGTYASTDVVMTADNGSDVQNYIDIGINSSTYASSAFSITGPNDGYIYTQSKNIAIGTAAAADIIFHTGGTLSSNERARITSNGCVGIGTCTPTSTLTVVGDISASGNAYFTNTVYSPGLNAGSIVPTNGSNTVSNVYAYVGSGCFNQAIGAGSVVGGGCFNNASGNLSTIQGGADNSTVGDLSVVGGGCNNTVSSNYGAILGGICNTTTCFGAIGGGACNTSTGRYTVIGGGNNNTVSCDYGVVAGGSYNSNCGCNSFIAGGYNNTINSGVCNAFVLGSGLNATASGYTYVNGIVACGNICACTINSSVICNNTTVFTNSISSINAITYTAYTCDTNTSRNTVIGGDLTVNGTIYSPFFSALTGTGSFVLSGGNKYSTVFSSGVNTLSSFTITHNLNTSDIVMTIIDYTTYQVVYPTVVIPNNNQVQVTFSFVPTTQYKISIIGL
jgi:hypothetical protein